MVKISVIMPVYNAQNYLENSLKSIINQTIDDIEIICVNDGSTDKSSYILDIYSKKYSFLKVFNQENQGPGMSRNKGINEANGEYVAFIDADDIYLDKDALNKMYNYAIKHDANMVCSNLRKIRQNGQLEEDYNYTNTGFTYFTEKKVQNSYEYGIPWGFYKNIYKKDFITSNNITFPNQIAGEDPIFLAKVLTNTKKIYALNIDFYGYNYSIGGGLNIKLNTYQKKKEYINHFMETFHILDKEGFEKVLINYKKEFIEYLTFRNNIHDQDIKTIIRESDLSYFFKEDDYGYLIIQLLNNEYLGTETSYEFIKYCLFQESMLEDNFVDEDRLKEYIELTRNNTLEEKISSFKQLKDIEAKTFEEKRQINGIVDKLKNNITHYIKSNNEILTSNSWKLTSFLRNLKHKI